VCGLREAEKQRQERRKNACPRRNNRMPGDDDLLQRTRAARGEQWRRCGNARVERM
jgi:hypothetical protein